MYTRVIPSHQSFNPSFCKATNIMIELAYLILIKSLKNFAGILMISVLSTKISRPCFSWIVAVSFSCITFIVTDFVHVGISMFVVGAKFIDSEILPSTTTKKKRQDLILLIKKICNQIVRKPQDTPTWTWDIFRCYFYSICFQ